MEIKSKLTRESIRLFFERLDVMDMECIDKIDETFKSNKKYKTMDKNGYYYNISSIQIYALINKNQKPSKFFNKNPYTYSNINNYLRLNNIKLELITTELNDSQAKLKFRCLEDGFEFERCWSNILKGFTKCDLCIGRTHYTVDMLKQIVKNIGCEFIDTEYRGVKKKHLFKCKCGRTFERDLCVVLYRKSCECEWCSNNVKHTYAFIKEDLAKHGIELLSTEYKNNYTKIKVRHECGFVIDRTYTSISTNDYKCPHCIKKGFYRDTEQFYKEIYDLVGDEYTFYGEYINSNTKMKVKHNICGHTYEVSPTKFINCNCRCPRCTSSKGEEEIMGFFTEANIPFKKEYKFKDLIGVGGQCLRYDFALHNKEDGLFLIEYDGIQHFEPVRGEELFKLTKEHDRRKDEYCKENNISLYRIPYWRKDNLINILEDILMKEGLK